MTYTVGQSVLLWPHQCAGPVGVAVIEQLASERVDLRLDGRLCVQAYDEISPLKGKSTRPASTATSEPAVAPRGSDQQSSSSGLFR